MQGEQHRCRADQRLDRAIRQRAEGESAEHDARERAGGQDQHQAPVTVRPVGPDADDLHHAEDGQNDAGGLARGDHQRHRRHGQVLAQPEAKPPLLMPAINRVGTAIAENHGSATGSASHAVKAADPAICPA